MILEKNIDIVGERAVLLMGTRLIMGIGAQSDHHR